MMPWKFCVTAVAIVNIIFSFYPDICFIFVPCLFLLLQFQFFFFHFLCVISVLSCRISISLNMLSWIINIKVVIICPTLSSMLVFLFAVLNCTISSLVLDGNGIYKKKSHQMSGQPILWTKE